MLESNRIIRPVRLVWRISAAVVCGWGLAVMTGLSSGTFIPSILCYYTIQSNFVCFLYLIALAVADIAGKRIRHEKVAGAVTIMITITMLVYNLVLDRNGFSMTEGSREVANMIVHLAVPLLILADWLFFAQKGRLSRREPFFWMGIPVAYYLYVLARAEISGTIPGRDTRFPYFFIDSDALGFPAVGLNILLFCVFFLAVGFVLVAFDKLLARMGKQLSE